ncbi:MAG TPA: sialidase family protein, partial [Vicinamibacterales bacterium]|nr:sialidase family protein [Vicinamibacterales bacterium]
MTEWLFRRRRLLAGALAALVCGAGLAATMGSTPASAQPAGQRPRPEPNEPLRFRYLGPESAGRVSAAAGIPGNITTYYLGAASGGIWKTTDGGRTWEPIFDDQEVQAIGALAVAPSDPDIVWAGTGEAWVIRPSDVMGDGIYKSTDAGRTWTHMGLRETGRIGRIVIHPRNPDIVFACALGRVTGPQEERGVFRTKDGGKTWERVLFVNPDTGCSGLAMHPTNPDILVAGTWQVVMHTWGMFSGGPGSGVYLSRDGGTTWQRLEKGLPKPPVGKIDVAFAPTNPRRVFALIQTANQGSLWRSDDGGESWEAVSWDRRLIGRAGYYIRVAVSSGDENEVIVANSSLHRSLDGGRTFNVLGGGCGDCHDIWIDPLNPDHFIVTGDNTTGITTTRGRTFSRIALPIGQMYHVAVDSRVPYWVYSNRQDDGTMRGRVDSPVAVTNVPSYGASMRGLGGWPGGGPGGGGPGGPGPGGPGGG